MNCRAQLIAHFVLAQFRCRAKFLSSRRAKEFSRLEDKMDKKMVPFIISCQARGPLHDNFLDPAFFIWVIISTPLRLSM